MVDHQGGADAGGLGDSAQTDVEAVLAVLLDRGIADPGDGRSIIGC